MIFLLLPVLSKCFLLEYNFPLSLCKSESRDCNMRGMLIVDIRANQLKIQTWKVCGLWGLIVANKLFVVDGYLGRKNDFSFWMWPPIDSPCPSGGWPCAHGQYQLDPMVSIIIHTEQCVFMYLWIYMFINTDIKQQFMKDEVTNLKEQEGIYEMVLERKGKENMM